MYSIGDAQIDPMTRKCGATDRAPRNGRDDQSGMFFMHFPANDNAEKLASGLKARLGKVAIK